MDRVVRGMMRSARNSAVMMACYMPLHLLFHSLVQNFLFGTFFHGAALSGAALTGATELAGFLASGPILIAAVAIFGGIMATGIFAAKHMHHTPKPEMSNDRARAPRQPEMTLAPAMGTPPIPVMLDSNPSAAAMADDAAPARAWADRPDIARSGDRVQQILADGRNADQSRAEAILAEKQAGTGAPTLH